MTLTPVLAAGVTVTDPGGTQPPNTQGVSTLLSYLEWGGAVVAVIGIMIVAYKMMLSPDRHQGNELGGLGKVAFGMVLFGAAFGIAGAVL